MNTDNLFKAIYSKFIAAPANDFYTATSGCLEYSKAPEDWEDNFAIIQGIGIDQDDIFSQEIERVFFQINLYSSDRTNCWDLLNKCKDLYDGVYLTVTGASAPIRIGRENQIPPIWNEQDNLYQATINFESMLY